jgi:hypothetical protein
MDGKNIMWHQQDEWSNQLYHKFVNGWRIHGSSLKPETVLKCFNKSVISSALVDTEDDVLFEDCGSSGGDSRSGKCASSDIDFRIQ